ncbi:MbnP family protein [Lacinutrix himadriensis]|uniref:MbnP family protein n=1 Tax=Lacinutrix himadriensis TaxID=641549 RepID=UPI0006E33C3D|nr:MbnP family protein [Lacinutrix himadriensis]
MKKILALAFFSILCFSCAEDTDDNISKNVSAAFKFTHSWNDTPVTNSDFNSIQFTNANGEEMSIEKLRYLVSNIRFEKANGEIQNTSGYFLIDVTNDVNLFFQPYTPIPKGEYTNVIFTFGFNNEDNYSETYTDLNSESWNVPDMLGGGYHYMQLEGKFIDNTATETGYAYHAIRAVDNSDPDNLLFQDTFIDVELGPVSITKDLTFNINMNIAEWFKNPNLWDLNTLHNMMMPNFNAQVMMFQNGQNVFSLTEISE